jgi:hypothetical protein
MALTQVQGGMILPSTTLTTPIVATTMGVGGATPAVSGAGITFPATQSASSNANTLDDYEEGTWTPTDGSGAGLSFSVGSGIYVKVGRMVYVQAKIVYPSTASGASATIAGLPFTLAATTDGNYPVSAFNSNGNQNAVQTLGLNGDVRANILNYQGVGSTNAQISAANINWNLTYYANT